MAANPWSPTSLTNTSVVKTNTPDEIAALKNINRDRICMFRRGAVGSVNWATAGSPPEVIVPLLLNTSVFTKEGSYGVGGATLGAWQAAREGYYRISGYCPRLFFNSGAACSIGINISSNLGVSWTNYGFKGYRPDPTDFTGLDFDFVVPMAVNDVVRIVQSLTLPSGSASGNTADTYPEKAQQIVEFLRPITLPA